MTRDNGSLSLQLKYTYHAAVKTCMELNSIYSRAYKYSVLRRPK